ncbi:MAG: CHAT domain-containing protein [Pyrinomonadaceae bacterium]|nr:CHAT domain-containing protein [Pyrinomonadaceae bacterium]
MRFFKALALCLSVIPTAAAATLPETILSYGLPDYAANQQSILQKLFEPENQEINLGILEPTQPKTISIESRARQRFQTQLKPRQFAQINILKNDLNLKIKISAPNGSAVSETISARFGNVSVRWVSETEGRYLIEVISLERNTAGKYTLDFLIPHPATPTDYEHIKFSRSFDEGEKLLTEGNQKSLQLALEKYQSAFVGFKQLQNYSEAARAAGRMGEVFLTWGNNKKAYEYFKTAYALSEKGGDKILPLTLLNLMNKSLIYLDKMSEARQILKKVFATIQTERSEIEARKLLFEEGNAELNIGEILYSEGNLPQSLSKFSSSIQKFKEVDDRRGQALGHLFSGYSLTDLGYLKDAREHFQQALALLEEGFHVKDRAMVLIVLGGDLFARGEPQQALKYYNAALDTFHLLNDTQNEGVALNGIARIYKELNEPRIAYEIYQQSMRLFEKNNNIDFQSTTLLSLGQNCKMLGKTDEALRHYRKSFEISQFLGKKRIAAYALNAIAELAEATGNPLGAIAELKKSIELLRSSGDRKGQAETFNSIGDIYAKNRQYLPALRVYRQALQISRTIGDKRLEAQTLYDIALTSRQIGELAESLDNIELALSIIESLRVLIANESLRMSYFSMATKYYDFYINLLMQLDKTMPENDYKFRAWQASEKVRSRVLLESLSLAGVRVKQAQNPELDQREENLARLINEKINLHSNLVTQNKPLEEINRSMQEMRRLFINYEEIRDEIKREDSSLKRLASPEKLDLSAVKTFMRDEPDSVFMEYLLTDEKGYLWTITSDRIESFELPSRSEIEKVSLEYHQILATPPPRQSATVTDSNADKQTEDYIAKACELSKMIIPPGALPPDKKRLLIVPDKALNYVSFDALLLSCASETSSQMSNDIPSYVPLMTKFETLTTPSAAILMEIRKNRGNEAGAPNFAAIFADPVFEPEDSDMPLNQDNRLISKPENSMTRLIYSSQEAEQIMEMTSPGNSLLLSRFDANLDEIKNPRIKNYQILHFATHSLANDEIPELSGIYLSQFNKNGEPVPGVLRLQSIYDLNINAKLIVLSSCKSAVGRDISGEGLISLSRGFMSAGAESVVGSLWKIDDQASAELMKYFYTFLIYDRMSLSEALRNAKLKMSTQKKWQSPYFWSGFVLQGEYRNNIEANSRQISIFWTVGKLIFILLFILGVIFVLKNRLSKPNR